MRLTSGSDLDESFFRPAAARDPELERTVSGILEDVRLEGDVAVRRYTLRFDGVNLDDFRVTREEVAGAVENVADEDLAAMRFAARNIERFARRQMEQFSDFDMETVPGVVAGQRVRPVQRAGVYAPGGNYPLPSSALMGVIPAKVAGVPEVVLCSPPGHGGRIHPATLAAAQIAGADEIYALGGVQAIGAMAYGTASVRPVDVVVGPGNRYVAEAKRQVYGTVGIDFVAGPTEVMIIADGSADPALVAADLLAQAEHDANAVPLLVTADPALAERVIKECERQLESLATAGTARKALDANGMVVTVASLEQAVDIANRRAPEHIELQVADPEPLAGALTGYGSLFASKGAAEALGDYTAGMNHTLPTGGSARYTGGLSVRDFLRLQTTLRVTEDGPASLGPHAVRLARLEGLEGHARSVEMRTKRG